jgi:hypothetical protein
MTTTDVTFLRSRSRRAGAGAAILVVGALLGTGITTLVVDDDAPSPPIAATADTTGNERAAAAVRKCVLGPMTAEAGERCRAAIAAAG